MSDALTARKQQLQPLFDQVREALRRELTRNGIEKEFAELTSELQYCELRRDSLGDSESLYGEWRDARGKKLGEIIAHASGEFFAEYDVLVDHPTDKRWFIEAVTAWGRPGVVKSELRLLEALPA